MLRFSACFLTIIFLGLGATATHAQQLLPNAITRIEGRLDGDQKRVVDTYVDKWARELLAGESAQSISLARQRLTEPLTRSGSTIDFKNHYSPKVASAISAGMTNENLLVRLNTAIVAASLTKGSGLALAQTGLRDDTIAVRYWAAKAAADALTNTEDTINAQRITRITDAIVEAVGQEPAGKVRQQMYIVLAEADTTESRAALLKAMDARVADYVSSGVSADLTAEAAGLNKLYYRLLFKDQVDKAEARQLAIVAMKYLQLVSDAMQADKLDANLRAIAMDIVTNCESILNWAVKIHEPGARNGPALEEPLKTGDKLQFMVNVGDWVTRVGTAAIGIRAELLKIK